MIDLKFKYRPAIDKILSAAPFNPDIAVILGSGLGGFADSLTAFKIILTEDIPGYPVPSIEGHTNKIYFSEFENKKLILFKGRTHPYEGYKLYECILPVLLSNELKTPYLLVTNAAGGINSDYIPGDLMLAESFNGIHLKKELTRLIGLTGIRERNNFLDFPSSELNRIILSAAKKSSIEIKKGTYWYTQGPSYETPAEIRMIARYGGDAVGMSTVHEAVFGGYLNMKTSSVSCITNYASGTSGSVLSHDDVTERAGLIERKFSTLLKETVKQLPCKT